MMFKTKKPITHGNRYSKKTVRSEYGEIELIYQEIVTVNLNRK